MGGEVVVEGQIEREIEREVEVELDEAGERGSAAGRRRGPGVDRGARVLATAAALVLAVGAFEGVAGQGGTGTGATGPPGSGPPGTGPGLPGRVGAAPPVPLAPRAPGAQLDRWSARELRGLPGLGTTRAVQVVEERRRRGGSLPLDAWASLPGIGEGTVERLRRWFEGAGASVDGRRTPREPDASLAGDPPDT